MSLNEIVPDKATIAAYRENGAAVMRGVVDETWQQRLGAAIERDIERPGPFFHGYVPEEGQGRFHGNVRTFEHDPDFRAFCLDSHMPRLAQAFFGSERVNLLYDQLFVKEPRTVNRTRWHNDQPYWPISGRQVLSFWIALDPTTIESGALEFIRGSHHWDKWFQPERFGDTKGHGEYERNRDYEPIPDVEGTRDDYDIVTWELEPGDVYVFQGLTVHGAGGNRTEDIRRRGYAVRYTGDDVRYDTRPGPNEHLKSDRHADGDRLDSERFPLVIAP
jgi:ectoine hydroxylase-related dioxygenase (phytanoyl-CoA dioxygenase family)